MADVQVKINRDGPYRVTGPIELIGPNDDPVSVPEGQPVFLCRCGGSTNKPFCDGTHSKIGFQGALKAVLDAEQPEGA